MRKGGEEEGGLGDKEREEERGRRQRVLGVRGGEIEDKGTGVRGRRCGSEGVAKGNG